MTDNPFEMVRKFNHEIVQIPYRRFPYKLDRNEARWLAHVCEEEVSEFKDAYRAEDLIGQVDALIDLIYFAMGGLTRLGVEPDKALDIFKSVHEANMLKFKGNKGRGSDLDAVKDKSWVGPEAKIKKILGEY